jgi:hypothetical protein
MSILMPLHSNWQEKAMMFGLEIREAASIAESINFLTLIQNQENSGNSVLLKWEILMFQLK